MEKKLKSYRRWTKQLIVEEILSLEEFSAKNAQKLRPALYGAAVRHFGSWKKAVETSGLDYQKARKKRPLGFWTRETVIGNIHNLHLKHSAFARKKHADLYNAALKIFGSWKNAVQAAGLNYDEVKKAAPKRK